MSGLLVSPEWLKAHLGDPRVKVVDGSWYLPAQNRDAKAEFLAGHIPGAVFFDIDAIADHSTDLPHMLPDEAAFAAAAGALGLSESDTIVVYDGMGLFSAPRVWWTLKVFGAQDVRVLDGGLPAWEQAGYAEEAGEAKPRPARFAASLAREKVRDFEDVRGALERHADGRRRTRRSALPRRSARAAARPPLRPHAGSAQPATTKSSRIAGGSCHPRRSASCSTRPMRRSQPPDHHHLRLRDHRRRAALRARRASARTT